jgi:hypothetical protein
MYWLVGVPDLYPVFIAVNGNILSQHSSGGREKEGNYQ